VALWYGAALGVIALVGSSAGVVNALRCKCWCKLQCETSVS
jgi:hypothetical protein